MSTRRCSLRPARALNSTSSRPSTTSKAATSARPDGAALPLRGRRDGSADRHPGDQRSLRSLHACSSCSRACRDLRLARRAQHRPWRIRHDRRLLCLRRAGQRLAVSCRGTLNARGVRDTRRHGRVDYDPSALPPALRHAGGDLGAEPAAAQDRRSHVRSRISQCEHSVSRDG